MKRNIFLIALILVSLIFIFVITQQEQRYKTDNDKQPVISSEVYKQIQLASQINITKDNQTVTFNKINQKWVVTQKDNYPLDMAKLRQLITQLTTGKLLEKKTNNKNLLSKLGLDDVNATYVTLSASDNSSTFKLAIGNNKGSNTYIRVYPESVGAQTWLASGDLTTPASALEWLDTAILQLPSNDITSIEFFNKDKIVSHLHKTTPEEKKFTIKTGKKNSPKYLNSTGSMLSNLTFLDVKQAVQHKGRYTKIITAHGMVLTLKMHQASSSYWVSIDIAFDEKLISSTLTKSQEDSDTKNPEAELSQEKQLVSNVNISRIKEKITQIRNRVKGWQYQITKEQYNLLIGN